MKEATISYKNHHKIFKTDVFGSGSDPVFKKIMDSDPVCPEWFNPDPVCPERMDPVISIKFDFEKNPSIIRKFSNSRISIIHKYLLILLMIKVDHPVIVFFNFQLYRLIARNRRL